MAHNRSPHRRWVCPPALAAADALVSVSAHEGLSLAHLEALAAGLPVIATDAGGTRELAWNNPAIRVLPLDRFLKPLRQWAGPYDISPDGDAIVGPSPGHPDLIQVCGFTGHGFMMAPVVGRLLARNLVHDEAHPMLERWDPCRFRDGRELRREDMIIG